MERTLKIYMFLSIILTFLTHMKWLTPHFEGNFNTFQDKLFFWKINEVENFVKNPTKVLYQRTSL